MTPADRVRLSAGQLSLELAPALGGAVTAFRLGDTPLFRDAKPGLTDVLDASAFPLVPYSNRIRDGRFTFRGHNVKLSPNLPPQPHPLHGQGWRRPWSVVEADAHEAELVFRHEADEWPWPYEARQRFRLDDHGLSYDLSLTNTSPEPMPAGLGLHPFFPANARTQLTARVQTVWTIDEEIMPVAERPAMGPFDLTDRRVNALGLDHGFGGWSGEAEIVWPDRGVTLRMTAPRTRFFQLYSPLEGRVFCAEPVTHANDAMSRPESEWKTLGVRVLDPGGETRLAVRFEVTSDSPS
jgi:aldose 1-epimerase